VHHPEGRLEGEAGAINSQNVLKGVFVERTGKHMVSQANGDLILNMSDPAPVSVTLLKVIIQNMHTSEAHER
jgi:hypothetical protein